MTAAASTTAPAATSAKAAPGRPRLTGPQAGAARQLVAALPVSADARLFALVLAVRAARTGWANVTCQDLRRYPDPHGVLDADPPPGVAVCLMACPSRSSPPSSRNGLICSPAAATS